MDGITVTDNGHGITKDNLEFIAEYGHTSKISNEEDLSNLKTKGFRGKALHAVSKMCNLNIKTFNEADKNGYELVLSPKMAERDLKICLKPVILHFILHEHYFPFDFHICIDILQQVWSTKICFLAKFYRALDG